MKIRRYASQLLFLIVSGAATPAAGQNVIDLRTTPKSGMLTVQTGGQLVGSRPAVDFSAGLGILIALSDMGDRISVQPSIDTSALQALTQGARTPPCVEARRGKLWLQWGGPGVRDTLSICMKDTANTYAWRIIL